MFFNFKLVASAIALAGVSVPLWLSCKKHCSLTKSSYFYKSSIDTSESVLECAENGRNYSVFLAFKDGASNNQKDIAFQVVDNNDNGKIKSGPRSVPNDTWSDWGIGIYKKNDGQAGGMKPKLKFL